MHWFWLLFLPAAAYQLLVLFAVARFALQKPVQSAVRPGVSILKPVRGLDPNTYEAFASQALQDYPEFEILFGVRDLSDAAVPAIRRLQGQFPNVSVRLIQATTDAPNGKVGVLIDLAQQARHPIWVVNDGDIKVTPSYLSEVVAELGGDGVGVVTCPYRAYAHSAATEWEALGIASDFIPSTMVAQMLGVREFGLGSTLAFRASDLQAAGGFEALADYLADDYQLAYRIAKLGKRSVLSRYVVETSLGEGTWPGVWHHQLRWARTIRRSKGGGYAGLPITHAGLWALTAVCAGAWPVAVGLVMLRMVAAASACAILRSASGKLAVLAPVWDLFAFAIWTGAWVGNTVRWRDKKLTISGDGRITRES